MEDSADLLYSGSNETRFDDVMNGIERIRSARLLFEDGETITGKIMVFSKSSRQGTHDARIEIRFESDDLTLEVSEFVSN